MINSKLTATLALVGATATVTLAVPGHADPMSDAFLAALNNAGVGYGDPSAAISMGQSVCPMLVEPGKSFASVASQVGNNGIPPDMAALFTGIAIQMYCPSMMTSIGNGTFLDWIQAPHM